MAPPRKYAPSTEGVIFRSLMQEAGFTQDEAAEALGINGSTIRRYLNGTLIIPEPTIRLLKVFAWLDIDHDDLLDLFTPGAKTRRFRKESSS